MSCFLLLIAANIGETVELETNVSYWYYTFIYDSSVRDVIATNWAAWVGRNCIYGFKKHK